MGGGGLTHERHFGLMEIDVKVQILMNFRIYRSFTGQSDTKFVRDVFTKIQACVFKCYKVLQC